MANLFLGVYVNLSIWYKLTDRTLMGAYVSLGGAALTIVLNVVFVPTYGYLASAWATFACYFGMAAVSYILGQKYYPVQYNLKSFFTYLLVALAFYFGFTFLNQQPSVQVLPPFVLSSLFMGTFLLLVWFLDGRKLLNRAV
jgi:O-antigen/teichoic acid export membrane protein